MYKEKNVKNYAYNYLELYRFIATFTQEKFQATHSWSDLDKHIYQKHWLTTGVFRWPTCFNSLAKQAFKKDFVKPTKVEQTL